MAPGAMACGGGANSSAGAPGQEHVDAAIPLSPLPSAEAAQAPPGMALPQSPFRYRAQAALEVVAEGLLAPAYWAVNHILDLQPTTAERGRQQQQRCGRCCGCARRAVVAVACATLLLLWLPLGTLGLLLWLPLQAARRPFTYQYTPGTVPARPWDLRQHRTFTFLSANVCLLPSGLAKFSNLGQTPQRAAYIARHLAPSAPEPAGDRASLVEAWHGDANSYGGTLGASGRDGGSVVVEIPLMAESVSPVLSEHFPNDADFVCLQEVFDPVAATILRQRLAGSFPHLLWDVGARGLRHGQLRVLGSGLLMASRYPLLAAGYHGFPNGTGEDALAAKGLLLAQVLLGRARGQRLVGYLACTHLQAPAADATIREEQLTLMLRWLRQFRQEEQRDGDLVAFDVLCGDLNFDNCSSGDALNQRHQLFQVYQDPCRHAPGQDQPWAIVPITVPILAKGTLLNYLKIYEEPVSTPEKMKRTLSQPDGRQQFLAAPILSSGAPDPAAGAEWQGRRVDYILHRAGTQLRTEAAEISFITQLATRSDHLPVALRLRVAPDIP